MRLPHGPNPSSPSRALPLDQGRSHRTEMTAKGVLQQRVLDGRHGSFHAPTVVRADDRFHGGVGVSLAIGLATKRNSATTGR